VIGELVELLIGFGSAFSLQNFKVFQSGGVDGTKAVGAKDLGCRFDESFSWQHQVRQEVSKTFERARRYRADIVP